MGKVIPLLFLNDSDSKFSFNSKLKFSSKHQNAVIQDFGLTSILSNS